MIQAILSLFLSVTWAQSTPTVQGVDTRTENMGLAVRELQSGRPTLTSSPHYRGTPTFEDEAVFRKNPGRHPEVGVIVPMYIYPSNARKNENYNRLMNLKKKYHNVPLWVIINPSDGPDTEADENYTLTIDRLKGAGAVVVGYVTTDETNRPLNAVFADIDTYKLQYPEIDGIFFDEMSNDSSFAIPYYQQLTEYGHAKGLYPMIGNPGALLEKVFFSSNTADYYITRETNVFPSTRILAGETELGMMESDYRLHGLLLHGATTFNHAALRDLLPYIGMLYITTDTLNNPWDTLSTLIEPTFALLAANNSGETAATSGYVYAKSIDGVAQSSQCVVTLEMSAVDYYGTLVFTSTATATENRRLGVLMDENPCLPGNYCKIGVSGLHRILTDGATTPGQFIYTSGTRCQATGGTTAGISVGGRWMSTSSGAGGAAWGWLD